MHKSLEVNEYLVNAKARVAWSRRVLFEGRVARERWRGRGRLRGRVRRAFHGADPGLSEFCCRAYMHLSLSIYIHVHIYIYVYIYI